MQRATPVTGGAEPRRNSRGATARAKLLDAALTSFAARGFHGTSTRDIADAAGMSPAGVYAHYRTKEELLFRLSVAGHTDALDVVTAAALSSVKPVERLRAITNAFVVWHAQFHTHARVVQYEMAALTPQHAASIVDLRRRTQLIVRDAIVAGVADGVFDTTDPVTAGRAIVSLGIDVARWYQPAGLLAPQTLGEDYAGLALRIVGAAYR